MILNDTEFQVTLDRISRFHAQVARIRDTESNPADYHASVSGYLRELDRMNLEVRDYLWTHPRELTASV